MVVTLPRIIVVDDLASQRAGRVSWLSAQPGVEAEGMTFEQAMALGPGWRDVQIAVLDAHDRRSSNRRSSAAAAAGIQPIAPHDRFVGVRVAELIRQHATHQQTRIILISAFARDNDLRARRIAQAGIDYVFEHYEVDQDVQTFAQAVLYPETFSPLRPSPVDWVAHGYSSVPDIQTAITAVEESPAAPILLGNQHLEDNKHLEWSWRTLRQKLRKHLHPDLWYDGRGPRKPEAPRKDWLLKQFDEALGKDLPVDPE
jgi:hypothetical protein